MNRCCLLQIISNVKYLARQGLALRGSDEFESNFRQIPLLRSRDLSELQNWLQRSDVFVQKDIQNEILNLFCREVQLEIVKTVKANGGKFGLLVDETTDMSCLKQVSVLVRTVDINYEIEEYLLGLVSTNRMDADSLFHIIEDVIIRCILPLEDCRGQGYDGAATMSGVQARVKQRNPSAPFSHCLMHSTDLGINDVLRSSTLMRKSLDVVGTIINFVRDSPKRVNQ